MRSRSGFCGAPVLVYRTPFSDLSAIGGDNLSEYKAWGTEGVYTRHDWFLGLLGVHCGQFRDPVRAFKSEAEREVVGDPIREGDLLYIQSGMTIVVPAWEVSALLDSEPLESARQERELEFLKHGIALTQSEAQD
jgi:hypothetical protein